MSTVPNPEFRLTKSGNLRRRALVSRLIEGCAVAAAIVAVTVLGILVFYVAQQGISAISWTFLTSSLPPPLGTGAGIGPALLGTAEIVAIATLIALPVGVLTALYLSEFSGPKLGSVVRLAIDMLNGIPTIVSAVVVFGLIVVGTGESGFAGSLALSIVMVPLITHASLEALMRVPGSLREAADALGVSRWRTVVGIILPSAVGGILTASMLAAARAAGETAPLLICDSLFGSGVQLNPFGAVPNLPFTIWTLTEAGTPQATHMAWGAAFVLLSAILVANVSARALLARAQRKNSR